MSKPIAIYARVSTTEQTTEHQLHQLRHYAMSRDVEHIEFIDEGVSGAKDSRPALNKLLAAVRRREVSAVVCTKLDRLARSTRHLCTLAAELEALSVDLVILDMAIDTRSPMGKLLFSILAGVAEFERDLIIDRTKAGMATARRKGKQIGRPRAMSADAVLRARRMRESGQSWRAIGGVLGVSHSTVVAAVRGS